MYILPDVFLQRTTSSTIRKTQLYSQLSSYNTFETNILLQKLQLFFPHHFRKSLESQTHIYFVPRVVWQFRKVKNGPENEVCFALFFIQGKTVLNAKITICTLLLPRVSLKRGRKRTGCLANTTPRQVDYTYFIIHISSSYVPESPMQRKTGRSVSSSYSYQ